MNKALFFFTALFLLCLQFPVYSEGISRIVTPKLTTTQTTTKITPWPTRMKHRLKQIWYEGNNDLYLTGYAWHNRYLYSKERLALGHYNEHAWGGGLGKGWYDEDDDWQALYAIVFLDSHTKVEPWAGYAFLKTLHLGEKVRLGGGFTLALTMRPDILNGYPFPAATPLVSVNYKRLALFAAYVPGFQDTGNILFMFARWSFGH